MPAGQSQTGTGLSKREYFAAKAMQGLLAQERYPHRLDISRRALEYADALIKEFERPTDGGSSGLGVVSNQNSDS